jgi:hypothetical protein
LGLHWFFDIPKKIISQSSPYFPSFVKNRYIFQTGIHTLPIKEARSHEMNHLLMQFILMSPWITFHCDQRVLVGFFEKISVKFGITSIESGKFFSK